MIINNFIIKCDTFNDIIILTEITVIIYESDLMGLWHVFCVDKLIISLYVTKHYDEFKDIYWYELWEYTDYCDKHRDLAKLQTINYTYFNYDLKVKNIIISKYSKQFFSKLKNSSEISTKQALYISKLVGKSTSELFMDKDKIINLKEYVSNYDYISYTHFECCYRDKEIIIDRHSQKYYRILKNSKKVTYTMAQHISKLLNKEIEKIFINEEDGKI